MMHLDKVSRWLKEPGVEIGPFKTPIPGIKPFYVDKVEWTTYAPHVPADQVEVEKSKLKAAYKNAVETGHEINIHFHSFEPSNVLELIEAMKHFKPHPFRWTLVDQAERFPADNP